MTTFNDFIILDAQKYEEDGVEKFRFAASATNGSAPNIIFIYDDYSFVETDEGPQARCYVRIGETSGDKIIPIEDDDSRYDKLYVVGIEILKQVTNYCVTEMSSASKEKSLLETGYAIQN